MESFFSPHLLKAMDSGPQPIVYRGKELAFFVLGLGFILLASAQFFYPRRMGQLFKAVGTRRFMNHLPRGGDVFNERICLNLTLVFFLTLPLMIMEANHYFVVYPVGQNLWDQFILYMEVFLLVAVYIGSKYFVVNMAGKIFKTHEATSQYSLTHFVFNQVEGILALVSLAIVVFSESRDVLLISIVLLSALYAYRLIRSFYIGLVDSKFSVLYLFIFFFILEILPVLMIIKLLLMYLDK